MRVAVFGASGRTGRHVVEEGLERGHEIAAFVRDASRFGESHERLDVVEGDGRDPAAATEAIRGSDGVISVLALAKAEDEPEHSEAVRTIVDVAKSEGVRRIVVTANNYVFHDDDVRPEFAATAREHRRNRERLRSSGLDWTILAASTLADGVGTGSYETSLDAKASGKRTDPRDLATAALDALGREVWVGHIVGVSS